MSVCLWFQADPELMFGLEAASLLIRTRQVRASGSKFWPPPLASRFERFFSSATTRGQISE